MNRNIVIEKKQNWEIVLVAKYPTLSKRYKQIADFFLSNKDLVDNGSINILAEGAGTSISGIVRFCQTLGYKGLKDLRIKASSDNCIPNQESVDNTFEAGDTPGDVLSKTFSKCAQALYDSLAMLNKDAFSDAVELLMSSENVDIYGYGGSASIAMLARHQFFKVGIRACVCTGDYVPKASYLDARGNYVIFIISSSGETPELVTWCKTVKQQPGIKVITLTNRPKSHLAKESDIVLSTAVKTLFSKNDNSITRIAQIAVIDSIYACLRLHHTDTVE